MKVAAITSELLHICIFAAHEAAEKRYNVDLLSVPYSGAHTLKDILNAVKWARAFYTIHDISWPDIDFALFGFGILDRVYCVCALEEAFTSRCAALEYME